MHITLLYPAVGKKAGAKYLRTWQMEPLMIATLKALTPPGIEVEFFDDRLEPIPADLCTDLIAISVEAYTARRAYALAERFRQRGIPVVMGGSHPTLVPEEAAAHADIVLVGNAETVWPQMLRDVQARSAQRYYYGTPQYHGLPDRSIFRGKHYLPISLVETGRGCPFHCEFCAVSAMYQAQYTPRPVADVAADIRQAGRRYVFLTDDNITADPTYTLELCHALEPLHIFWASQATLTVANNPKLLDALAHSGCRMLLIGFESVEPANLRQMHKSWITQLGDRDTLVQRIHQVGISIYATFVFGFDHDTPASFEQALAFSRKHGFFFAAFNHLLPFPGTPLYARLRQEHRLLTEHWWLAPGYEYGQVVFQPARFSPEDLSMRCAEARRKFFSFLSILKRGLQLVRRRPPLRLFLAYWLQNLTMQREVDERLGLPIGEGLDDWPK